MFSELATQHDTNLALLFDVPDAQARFVVYARRTLPPTPTAYSHRRIINAEHLHHRSKHSKRSLADKQFFEESQVITFNYSFKLIFIII